MTELELYSDAHCHSDFSDGILTALNAVTPADWPSVLTTPHPFIGTHPWHSSETIELESALKNAANAGCGEIGLDSVHDRPTDEEISAQTTAFKDQLTVAMNLGRPVQIHCVRAFDRLRPLLKRAAAGAAARGAGAPRVLLHAFSGSVRDIQDIESALGTKVWISINRKFSIENTGRKTRFAITSHPQEYVCIESDWEGDDQQGRLDELKACAQALAELRGQSVDECLAATKDALKRYLGLI